MNKPDDWLQHPYTQHLRAQMAEEKAAKLEGVLRAASASTDPTVLRALLEYRRREQALEMLQADTKEETK